MPQKRRGKRTVSVQVKGKVATPKTADAPSSDDDTLPAPPPPPEKTRTAPSTSAPPPPPEKTQAGTAHLAEFLDRDPKNATDPKKIVKDFLDVDDHIPTHQQWSIYSYCEPPISTFEAKEFFDFQKYMEKFGVKYLVDILGMAPQVPRVSEASVETKATETKAAPAVPQVSVETKATPANEVSVETKATPANEVSTTTPVPALPVFSDKLIKDFFQDYKEFKEINAPILLKGFTDTYGKDFGTTRMVKFHGAYSSQEKARSVAVNLCKGDHDFPTIVAQTGYWAKFNPSQKDIESHVRTNELANEVVKAERLNKQKSEDWYIKRKQALMQRMLVEQPKSEILKQLVEPQKEEEKKDNFKYSPEFLQQKLLERPEDPKVKELEAIEKELGEFGQYKKERTEPIDESKMISIPLIPTDKPMHSAGGAPTPATDSKQPMDPMEARRAFHKQYS